MAPSIFQKAFSFASAVAEFTESGFAITSKEEYEQRLRECDSCEDRTGSVCDNCGCIIILKAKMKPQRCPKGKWEAIPIPK